MMRHFAWSHGKTCYLLADLKELHLLESLGLRREHGPRIRKMNLSAFLGGESGPPAEVQYSEQKSNIREQESNVYVGHDRHLTDQSQNQNLRPLTRPSSPTPCGNVEKKKPATPQQRRYVIIRCLVGRALEILRSKPGISDFDLAEDLKEWAASLDIPYSDAWPGARSPIDQAIEIAIRRAKVTWVRKKTA
jgi:hypothetical protein